ncbi:MAG: BatD family protein [Candidatus Gracilibacteria bacterium]|nr:BatD family protein [Candidatus Gracilibacteria bacterium]
MNKISKIIVSQILFFLCLSNIYAFDANLQIDKKDIDINDSVNLRIEVSSEQGGQIGVKEIKGLENFEIINQSQSQSSASNVVIVNGKTETKTESKINLDLSLKAKVKGDFEIGPAILSDGSMEVTTNTVKVNVTGDNLYVNNNHININNNQANTNNANNGNINNSKQDKDYIGDYEKVDKKNFNDNASLYLLIGVILIITIIIYLSLKKNPELIDKLINKNDENEELRNTEKSNKNKIITETQENKVEEKIVDKEKIQNITNIDYPENIAENFISNINNIFKQKLSQKYNIGNIENKTFEEILGYVNDENMENIQEVISLLNKAKYSNMSADNEKILELVKKI